MRKQIMLLLIALFTLVVTSAPTMLGRVWAATAGSHSQQTGSTPESAYLTGPNAGDALDIALAYLRQNAATLGLTAADLRNVVVKDRYVTQHNGVTHLYLRQRYQAIEVDNADININIAANGAVISLGNRFVANLAAKVNNTTPTYTAVAAVERATQYLQLPATQPFETLEAPGGSDQATTLSGGGASTEPIPVRLTYVRQPGEAVQLAWQAQLHPPDGKHVWRLAVDAVNGALLAKVDIVLHYRKNAQTQAAPLQTAPVASSEAEPIDNTASLAKQPTSPLRTPTYRVFALPLEHPDDGPGLPASQTLISDPSDPVASPYGWHDIDGQPGHEFNDTRGNNVSAQEDRNGDDLDGFRPTGLKPQRFNFDYRFDPASDPSENPTFSAVIVNLFYWNNVLHDLMYRYGFDETSGNFQENNYDRGGLGVDAVQADAQDGYDFGARDNAYFIPTADGERPRLGMFVWDYTVPNRDSDVDNGIIIHEYAHGISTRLVGGPWNPYCLYNAEQMGEGWSDWFTLALTAKPGDDGGRPRGLGTYVLGQPPDGSGIRQYAYSTDWAINPLTYAAIQQNPDIYFVGQVWASMLWDLHWALVGQYGYDANLYTGAGGNNIALQLVMDGMKFAPCDPGFVDARDAILTADQVDYGGANQCTIWQAFARRGLGFSANQGSPYDTFDGHQAFDMPPVCRDDLSLTKSGTPPVVEVGRDISFEFVANNYTSQTLTGLTLSDPIPEHTTYVPDSASEGGEFVDGVVTWQLPDLNPDEMAVRSFAVTVDHDYPDAVEVFFDDMESGPQNWLADGFWQWLDDAEPCGRSASPTHSWYFGDTATCTYPDNSGGRLTSAAPITLPPGKVTLTFASWEDIEPCCEQRQVLVSTDGVNFTTVWSSNNNSAAWYEATVDLSSYSGQTIWISFEFTADSSIFYTGWYVDDVRIVGAPGIVNTATLTSNEGVMVTASATNEVVKLPHIDVTPITLEATLKVGEKVEQTLTLANVGAAPLQFRIGVRSADATPPTGDAGSPGSIAGTTAAVRVPATQAKPNGSPSYAGDSIQARAGFAYQPKLGGLEGATAPNVLLLAAADAYQIQAILDAYPDLGLVDLFDARGQTPTFDQLLTYDTVIVIADNAFADPVALGDLLAEYVDSGGGVIQSVATFFDPYENGWGLRGRWLNEGYSPFIGTGDWFSFATLGEFDATHPIMQGVVEAGDYYRQIMELAPGANLVASWTDDEFVATKGSVVGLNTFLADSYAWTGDVDLIVHNSIIWLQSQQAAPINWLAATPLTGAVAADETQDVQVTFDGSAPDVVNGDYSAFLRIINNDPERPVVDIPVTLHAIGPELILGDGGSTWYGRPVAVPVNFVANDIAIAAAAFSVDMDESCLRFDPTDGDGDGIPDAIHFNLPVGFQGTATVDLSDTTGELDFFIADLQPPLAALPDSNLATIEFTTACLPGDDPLGVAVNFAALPRATLSDLSGVTVLPATNPGLITVDPGLPGDCNQDGAVNAGDTISCVLEIFDGDGAFWLDAPGGSFAGSPQGCDSNQDTEINAGDIICTVLIIFQGQGACGQTVGSASVATPAAATLSLGSGVAASPGASVTVPIQLNANDNAVAAAAFTLVFDPALLHFDPADANNDGVSDALHLNTPADFVKSVTVAEPGRIQVVLADLTLPLAPLPDGVLAELTLTADGAAGGKTAAISFATADEPSLGSDAGLSIPLSTSGGSVVIMAPDDTGQENRILLPTIYN